VKLDDPRVLLVLVVGFVVGDRDGRGVGGFTGGLDCLLVFVGL
jgi:hypothetical protein